MDMSDLLAGNAILAHARVPGKKQLLQLMGARGADIAGLDERMVCDRLLERERLCTTGVGQGVAIPHARIPNLERLHGVFARLDQPIDFEAVDDKPVDLVFMLLSPEDAGADHLKALARISRLLRDESMCNKLRGSDGADALHALLTESLAAAA